MLNEFITWFESQWHVIAPILISALPSLGAVVGIINSAKNLVKDNKTLLGNVIAQVKSVNETAIKDLISQFKSAFDGVIKELDVVRNDNKLLAQIISEVVLSKAVPNSTKERIVLLAKEMSNPVVKDIATAEDDKPKEEIKPVEVKTVELDLNINADTTKSNSVPYVPIY